MGILSKIFEDRRLRQDKDFYSRIFESVAADRLQVGGCWYIRGNAVADHEYREN